MLATRFYLLLAIAFYFAYGDLPSDVNAGEEFTTHNWRQAVIEDFSTSMKPTALLDGDHLHQDSLMSRSKRSNKEGQFTYLPEGGQTFQEKRQKLRRSLVEEKHKVDAATETESLKTESLPTEARHDEEVKNGLVNSEEFEILSPPDQGNMTSNISTTPEPQKKNVETMALNHWNLSTPSEKIVIVVIASCVMIIIIVCGVIVCCKTHQDRQDADTADPEADGLLNARDGKRKKSSRRSKSTYNTVMEDYDRRYDRKRAQNARRTPFGLIDLAADEERIEYDDST